MRTPNRAMVIEREWILLPLAETENSEILSSGSHSLRCGSEVSSQEDIQQGVGYK